MEVKFIRISTPAAANRKPVGLIAQLAEHYTGIAEIINISLVFLLNIVLLNPFADNFVVLFFLTPCVAVREFDFCWRSCFVVFVCFIFFIFVHYIFFPF